MFIKMPILQIMLAALLCISVIHAQNFTRAELKDDLNFLLDKLENFHPDPYWETPKDGFDSIQHDLVSSDIILSRENVFISILKIMSLTNDGHNDVYPPEDWQEFKQRLPIKINIFSDGLYITAASQEYANLIGTKLLAIGDFKIDEVVNNIQDLIISDNHYGKKELFEDYIRMPAILKALKFTKTSNCVRFTLEDQIENVFTTSIRADLDSKLTGAGPPRRSIPESWVGIANQLQGPWQQNLDKNYWFTFLEPENTVYFQFQKVQNSEDESFQDFNKRLFSFIKDNPVERLVIDLRWNRGGNAYLLQPLLHELIRSKKLNKPGSLFVLMSNYTFSAAITLAVDIEKHTHAIFVGQPTAAGPNYHAEVKSFFLPNSGIEIEISMSFWQLSDPRDKRAWLQPDIEVPFTFADYRSDIDRTLDAALEFQPSDFKKDYDRSPVYNWFRKSQNVANSRK